MSIDLVRNAPKTPARTASIQSMENSMKGDAKAWLDLFADDAIVQDPYGPSPMNPSGVQFAIATRPPGLVTRRSSAATRAGR